MERAPLNPTNPKVREAVERLRRGEFVLVYDGDGREAEVDLLVAADKMTPKHVEVMRRDGGGLIFLAVDPAVGERLGLPFLQDVFQESAKGHPVLGRLVPDDLPYDARSSFSITINHRDTFTGITDADRALTISAFGRLGAESLDMAPEDAQRRFGEAFRAPGHVFLCVGARGLLSARSGHTELALALARMAGAAPAVAGCEMMAPGDALPLDEARAWAAAHDTVLLTGQEVAEAWGNFNPEKRDAVVKA